MGKPKATLGTADVVALMVGVVVGAGIFRTPSLVAGNAGSASLVLTAWILGGVISALGALCYAELTTSYPDAGGDYHFLGRSFGSGVGFLFVWSRMTVVQTGSLALQAFLVGDYAARALPVAGAASSALYAGLAVALLTGLNLLGFQLGRRVQRALSLATLVGLLVVLGVGSLAGAPGPAEAPRALGDTAVGPFGLALVFVLLTYGGWNEVSYLSAEVRGGPRVMVRAILGGVAVITALYVLANALLLSRLGLAGVAGSDAVMADLVERAAGPAGAWGVSALVVVAALSTMNATMITGARSGYAVGRDFERLGFLGLWPDRANTPAAALLVQGAAALALVLLGAATRDGFATMVEYTAPVFWLFFLLVGVSLLVLRRKDPDLRRPFRVPLFPVVPLLFCASTAYMLVASLRHTGLGAAVGVGVLLLGLPVLAYARARGAGRPKEAKGRAR